MKNKGYIYAILSAILFGSAGLFVKLSYDVGLEAVQLLIIQYIIAVSLMFLLLAIKNKFRFKVNKKEVFYLFILGAVGNTLMTVFYYKAFEYLPMAVVTMLLFTYPIMVFIYELLFRKGNIDSKKVIAIFLAFIGCMFVLNILGGNNSYNFIGIVFGILSAVFYAFMNIYSEKRLKNVEALTINAFSTLFSLMMLLLFSYKSILFGSNITLGGIRYAFILAVFCEIIPLTLLYGAIKLIGSLKVSIISNLELPTSMLISFFILNEAITITQIIGAILIFLAVKFITD